MALQVPSYVDNGINAANKQVSNVADPINLTDALNVNYADTRYQAKITLSGSGFVKYTGSSFTVSSILSSDLPDLSATYQPKAANLTSLASNTTSGFVKFTGSTLSYATLTTTDIPNLSATYQSKNSNLDSISSLSGSGAVRFNGTTFSVGITASDIPALDSSKITTGSFASSRISGLATSATTDTTNATNITTGTLNIPEVSPTAVLARTSGLGYKTGVGTGTSITSITRGATTDIGTALVGRLVFASATLAANTYFDTTITASSLGTNDVPVVAIYSSTGTTAYTATVSATYAGSFVLRITNFTAASATTQIGVNFLILKGSIN